MKSLFKKQNRPLYMRILFVVLAFVFMVTLSYAFLSRIVRENLVRNADGVLDVAATRNSTRLQKCKAVMERFAGEMREMVLRGDTVSVLQE